MKYGDAKLIAEWVLLLRQENSVRKDLPDERMPSGVVCRDFEVYCDKDEFIDGIIASARAEDAVAWAVASKDVPRSYAINQVNNWRFWEDAIDLTRN